ncbi:hypothetical protein F4859DRAFT_255491 [Xylaria cf. heliscus]|nr:hypothetical protein F4859DRAFT_255491 [Xylaria cf. heliscus]
MGNTPSVEAPRKGTRATQKLSKPRTGNPATAGLLNPSSVADIIRRPPSTAGRRSSLPCTSTPVPSPRHPESEDTALDDDLVASQIDPVLIEDYLPHPLFQPGPQVALHLGGQSIGVVGSLSRGRRTSRTDSVYTVVDEAYEQAQLGLAASLPRNVSQSSMNYDLPFYEANQLLNLAEAPPFRDQPLVSEDPLQVALSRRRSYTTSYHPAHPDATVLLPRADSDASLYTPMRRRSLMTPGVATRPAPVDVDLPPKTQTETPRCDSLESTGLDFLSIPHMTFDPSLVPRAHTPCETDYKQTGAFKHGTLRITNGSPARTPAREAADNGLSANSSPTRMRQGSYFDAGSQVQEEQNVDSNGSQCPVPPLIGIASSDDSVNDPTAAANEQEAAISFLPELTLSMSPFSLSEVEQELPELQTTSKHTAIEDELFEEGSPEYDTEVLNVCLDLDVNPSSSSPSTSSEEGKQKEITRSDSGVVASPASSTPHKSLSKADSGYSSSVSIRSLSSKRNGQQEVKHFHNPEVVSPKGPTFQDAKLLSNTPMRAHSTTGGASGLQSQIPSPGSPPPLVPEKDDIWITKLGALSSDLQDLSKTLGPLPNKAPAGEIPNPAHRPILGSNNTSMSNSTSVSNTRKPGKLQRLLSGTREPLAVHITHVEDRDASVPPVPQVPQGNPHKHAGLPVDFENPPENADVWEDNSKITAVKNLSITHQHDLTIQGHQDNGSSAQTGRDRARSFKSSFRLHSLGSTITRAASSVMKTPLLRKPTLVRTKPSDPDAIDPVSDSATTIEYSGEASQWHTRVMGSMDTIPLNATNAGWQYGGLAVTKDRSNSLSASMSNNSSRIHEDTRRSSLASQSEHHANNFPRPSYPGQYMPSRTPPPISMKTRNIGPLRVPAPLRPRSTPPVKPDPPMLSHKPSREGVHSYPPYHYPMSSNYAGSSRQSSQENLYTYSAAQIQAFLNQQSQIPGITPIRPSTVQPPTEGYWTPSGIPNQNQNTAPSWEPSFDHSRRNSLASQTSQRSTPSNGQPWSHYGPYDAPTLRHRSSYDGYSFQTRPSYEQDNGPYPSPAYGNGQMYVNNTLSNQPMLHQSRQYQQHTRYLPRGHFRHHSLDQYGSPVPYRVLHSYNSPAYRGVPIWSG